MLASSQLPHHSSVCVVDVLGIVSLGCLSVTKTNASSKKKTGKIGIILQAVL